MSAVVLPILRNPSVAVQNPISLSVSVTPAASKVSDIHAQAAKTLLDWKSSRAVSPAKSPTPLISADNPSVQLDALFDGSLPSSREVLSRASSRGLTPASLALALSDSKSASDASAHLSALGVLGSKEAALASTDEPVFRFLLTRIWHKTAHTLPADFPIDSTFGIPALKVERDGVTYFVHGVAHGQHSPPHRGAVLSLVRRVQAAGHALYSEQNLPAYYGYKAGFETLDHKAPDGYPTTVVAAAPGFTPASLFVKRAIDWTITPGTIFASAIWGLAAHASILPWTCLGVSLAVAFFVLTGGLPYSRMLRRRRAAEARAEGLEDIADQYADEARHFFVAKPDLGVLRDLELPQPLGATDDTYSVRSRAIADAVAADAAAAGASAVHLVVGHLHAHEVAWRLAEGPRVTVPGSQVS